MATALAQVTFENASGFTADRVVHTFHFAVVAPTVSVVDAGAISDQLQSFYNVIHAPGTSPLGDEMSQVISRSLSQVKVYNLTAPPPRPPVLAENWTLVPTGTTNSLPNEVALVLSYKAQPTAGVPLNRSRGRLYFGPVAAGDTSLSAGDVRPTASFMNKLLGAGQFLMTPFGTAGSIQWVVYSPTARAAGSPENIYARAVNACHVDNAFDTQRRRGRAATTRFTS